MADTSVLEILMSVFWLLRDFCLLGAVGYSLWALFSPTNWGRAAGLWILASLGTIAGVITPDYEFGLLRITNPIAVLGLVLSGMILVLAPRIRAVIRH